MWDDYHKLSKNFDILSIKILSLTFHFVPPLISHFERGQYALAQI
jgi:hypothetical protein